MEKEKEAAEQNVKTVVSQLKGNLVGTVLYKSKMFPEGEYGMSVCYTFERSDKMSKCPLNLITWRSLVSLVSEPGLDRWMGKEPRIDKRLKSETEFKKMAKRTSLL